MTIQFMIAHTAQGIGVTRRVYRRLTSQAGGCMLYHSFNNKAIERNIKLARTRKPCSKRRSSTAARRCRCTGTWASTAASPRSRCFLRRSFRSRCFVSSPFPAAAAEAASSAAQLSPFPSLSPTPWGCDLTYCPCGTCRPVDKIYDIIITWGMSWKLINVGRCQFRGQM